MDGDPPPQAAAGTEPGHVGPAGYSWSTTMPDDILRHDISDEDLDVLCDPAREDFRERKWVALGLGLGFSPTAIQALTQHSATNPMSMGDVIQVVLMFVCFAVWLVLLQVVKASSRVAYTKRDEIRARKGKRVQNVAGE